MGSNTAAHASTHSVEQIVRAAVLAKHQPPRRTQMAPLVVASYRSRTGLVLVAFALFVGLPGVIIGLTAEGPLWAGGIIVAVCGAAIVTFGGAPAVRAARYNAAARNGIVVAGEVLESAWNPPGLRPPTVEAGLHGTTRGVRRVHHPNGVFTEPFESDAAWAREIQAGTHLWLLADARDQRVFFDLGLQSPPDASTDSGQ